MTSIIDNYSVATFCPTKTVKHDLVHMN